MGEGVSKLEVNLVSLILAIASLILAGTGLILSIFSMIKFWGENPSDKRQNGGDGSDHATGQREDS